MFITPVLLQNGRLTLAPMAGVNWSVKPLMNGVSKNMATIAVAPSTFIFSPGAIETYYLFGLSMAFSSSGTPDSTDFGNIVALPLGIDLDIRSNGITSTVLNIKDNLDLALTFNSYSVTGGSAGFLNNADTYLGSAILNAPILVKGTTSDFVRAVIKSPTIGSGSDLRIYAHLYKEQ